MDDFEVGFLFGVAMCTVMVVLSKLVTLAVEFARSPNE